ncbi:hypothetical protein MHU86_12414 [Fragilaria crotonensis]|nr:hypothetical protein MHU86_12414 [Fragilaria crotonensis]
MGFLMREPEEGRGNMLVSIYLIKVGSIFAPTVGIRTSNRDSDKFLFLFRRREEWPSCCKNNEEESLESEYEEEDDEDNEVNEDDEQDDDEDDEQEDC